MPAKTDTGARGEDDRPVLPGHVRRAAGRGRDRDRSLPAGRASILNTGPNGLAEVVYALTSAASSNGSAFAGLSSNTTFYNTLLAVVRLLGRYLPTVFVLGLVGSLAKQRPIAVTPGSLRTDQPMFVVLTVGVAVILVFVTFLPALALGLLAEGLH